MMPISAQALALSVMVAQVAAQPAAPSQPMGPSEQIPSVTVTARRPVVVTGTDWCPEPKPDRYPAEADPRVIDSYPRRGSLIAPGWVQVRVTFDAPMSCYAEVTLEGGAQDPCEPDGTWVAPDRRSFLLRCRLAADTNYTLRFARRDGRGFVGMSGREAEAFTLRFGASDAAAVAAPELAARDDPGPPDARRTTALVTCGDAPVDAKGEDCSHRRLKAPP